MATELQRRKYEQHFDRYDADGDGVITQSDVDRLVQGWCVGFGVTPGSRQWREVTDAANRLWQSLLAGADGDADRAIGKQEWVSRHEDADFVADVAIPLGQATFELGDVDHDGRVGLSEWMTLQTVAGVGQVEALELFQRLDSDGDGFVTAQEHAAALREFFHGTEADSAGNVLAGRV